MSPRAKASIAALVIVATNWHWHYSEQGPTSGHSMDAEGAGIVCLICIIALYVQALYLYHLIRDLLHAQVKIPRSEKLASWLPVLLLLPVFYSHISYSESFTAEGKVTISRGYGSESEGVAMSLFLIASTFLMANQVYRNLQRLAPKEIASGKAGWAFCEEKSAHAASSKG